MTILGRFSYSAFRNLPKSPCVWCGGLFYNGFNDGRIRCAECESGSADNLVHHAGRDVALMIEAGIVRRWTVWFGEGYDPSNETSRTAVLKPKVVWKHDKTQQPKQSSKSF